MFEGIDNPWYEVAGVEAFSKAKAVPYPRTYWLHVGEPTELHEPYICLSKLVKHTPASAKEEGWYLHPRQRSLQRVTSGRVEFDVCRGWLQTCIANHTDLCGQSVTFMQQLLNIKLIDIHQRRVVSAPAHPKYLALSYVRGNLSTHKHRRAHGVSHSPPGHILKEGLLPEQISQTIEDAITFTKSLGLQYLWVDMFCIDQGDPLELQAQIQSMDLTFECAVATIIANDGTSMDAGLGGISRPLECTAQPVFRSPYGVFMATFIDYAWASQGASPWDFRAWTFQEGLLSRRCFIFDRYHVNMRCWDELFHDTMSLDPSRHRIPTDQSDKFFWENGWSLNINQTVFLFTAFDALVSSYSRRQLTFQSDALNACRGTLSKITRNTGVGFLWGLPVVAIIKALAWKAHQDDCVVRRPGFPSWSWLGWKGRIEYAYWMTEVEDFEEEAEAKRVDRLNSERSPPVPNSAQSAAASLIIYSKEAFVETKQLMEDPSSHALRVSSAVARFRLRMVRKQGELFNTTPSETAVGDHWTLLNKDGEPLCDVVGVGSSFQETDHFFRLHPSVSRMLPKAKDGGTYGEFLFLRYWPAIRDHHTTKNWLYDQVQALLIVRGRDGQGDTWRAASVIMRLEDWVAVDATPAVVTLT